MKRKRAAGICLVLFFLLFFHTSASGEAAIDFNGFIPGGEEGENVSVSTEENGGIKIEFSFDKEGYHTVTAFKNDKRELKKESGIRFFAENLSGAPARMNLAVINSEGTVFQVEDGCYVRLIPDGEPEGEVYSLTKNGCFELPAGFAGEAEAPFELFGASVKELTGYGFLCVSEGDALCSLVINRMAFVSKQDLKDAAEGAFLAIEGPDAMQKSPVGESKEKYKALLCNMLGEKEETAAVFSTGESSQEILADGEGWVTVPAGTNKASFLLEASAKEGLKAQKEIALTESWTRQVRTENGYDASIAPPAEVSSVAGDMAVLTQEKVLRLIRAAFLAAVLVLFAYYAVIRKRNRIRRE